MSPYPYALVANEDGDRTLTVLVPGRSPLVIAADHPNFERVLEAASELLPGFNDGELEELADISSAVASRFDQLSERVSVANGRVYFDGDELVNALTRHILRVLEAGEDFRPLVAFLERIAANPNGHSREQLYEWLDRRDFTITQDGYIVAYKGVQRQADGALVSINRGPAVVNGTAVNGAVPNEINAVVEIARSKVAFDPSVGCASGLHVGTYHYAQSWARGALLKVVVDPRDVVSVPTDSDAAKVRVCRYRVIEIIDAPETEPVAEFFAEVTGDVPESDGEDGSYYYAEPY